MSIRKHVEWDGKQFRGYVDLGTGINDDSLPEATDALVFMAVAVNGSWKVPCGYFSRQWSYWTGESQLDERMHHQVAWSRGEGGLFHMRWPYVSPVDVEVAGRSVVTW